MKTKNVLRTVLLTLLGRWFFRPFLSWFYFLLLRINPVLVITTHSLPHTTHPRTSVWVGVSCSNPLRYVLHFTLSPLGAKQSRKVHLDLFFYTTGRVLFFVLRTLSDLRPCPLYGGKFLFCGGNGGRPNLKLKYQCPLRFDTSITNFYYYYVLVTVWTPCFFGVPTDTDPPPLLPPYNHFTR